MNEITKAPTAEVILHNTHAGKVFDLVEVRADARRFPRVKDTDATQAIAYTRQIVLSAHLVLGREATPEDVDFISRTLYGLIMSDDRLGAKHISWYEIGRAVKYAAADGELYGISAATLFGAVCKYIREEGSRADKQARQSSPTPQLPPEVVAYIDRVAGGIAATKKV